MDRFKTGITGVDDAIGGLPTGKTTLVTGDAGTGKTIFGLQFANNCCYQGIKTAYLATEETAEDIKLQARSINFGFDEYEEKGLFNIIEILSSRMSEMESAIAIHTEARKGNFQGLIEAIPMDVKAVVIDSIGSHITNLKPQEFKDRFDFLVFQLRKQEITTLVIIDSATSKEYNDLALFSAYGAITLMKRENPYTGQRERIMDVVKMRSSPTPLQPLTYKITSNGIMISQIKEEGNTK